MSQSEDLEAVDRYIAGGAQPKTPAAAKVRDKWISWYNALSWWEKSMDGATWDKARNLRTEYNRVNATTPAEKEAVEKTVMTGVTTENIQGGTSKVQSSGYIEEPLISTKTKLAMLGTLGTVALVVGGGAAAVAALYVLKVVYLDSGLAVARASRG